MSGYPFDHADPADAVARFRAAELARSTAHQAWMDATGSAETCAAYDAWCATEPEYRAALAALPEHAKPALGLPVLCQSQSRPDESGGGCLAWFLGLSAVFSAAFGFLVIILVLAAAIRLSRC